MTKLATLLDVAQGIETPDSTLDQLAQVGRNGEEAALERVFDLAPCHTHAAKLREKLVAEGFWLERDGSQAATFVKLAEEGSRAAVAQLKKLADEGSQEAFRWVKGLYDADEGSGSHVINSENSLVRKLAGKERLLTAYVLQRDIDSMRTKMLSADPTPLERILVDRIVYCHAAVNMYEATFAQGTSWSLQQGEYHQRTIDKAHRRLLTAVETLARVRRLQIVPSLQVNIAQKQVNVGAVAV